MLHGFLKQFYISTEQKSDSRGCMPFIIELNSWWLKGESMLIDTLYTREKVSNKTRCSRNQRTILTMSNKSLIFLCSSQLTTWESLILWEAYNQSNRNSQLLQSLKKKSLSYPQIQTPIPLYQFPQYMPLNKRI